MVRERIKQLQSIELVEGKIDSKKLGNLVLWHKIANEIIYLIGTEDGYDEIKQHIQFEAEKHNILVPDKKFLEQEKRYNLI